MKTRCCALGILLLLPWVAQAQKKPGEAASLEKIELKGAVAPGGRVTAVIKVKLDKGYHVHSDKPSQPEFIPTVLKVGSAAGVKAGNVVYPAAKTERVEGLEKPLSVFEEHFEVSVPLGLSAAAKLPLSVPATLSYQACQGAKCYAPRDLKFEIKLPAAD